MCEELPEILTNVEIGSIVTFRNGTTAKVVAEQFLDANTFPYQSEPVEIITTEGGEPNVYYLTGIHSAEGDPDYDIVSVDNSQLKTKLENQQLPSIYVAMALVFLNCDYLIETKTQRKLKLKPPAADSFYYIYDPVTNTIVDNVRDCETVAVFESGTICIHGRTYDLVKVKLIPVNLRELKIK